MFSYCPRIKSICPTNGWNGDVLICTAGKFDGVPVDEIPDDKKCSAQEKIKRKAIAYEDTVKRDIK